MKNKIKYISIGIITSFLIFLLFGIFTALIPNRFFIRMIEPTILDIILLILTSMLLGSYIALSLYKKSKENKCNYAATGGAFLGIFSFACPICNVFFISLFGASAILTYFEPIRPLLGFLSVGLIGSAVIYRIKELKLKNF